MKYLLEWTRDLSVNVDAIDEQHKELVNQINDFFDAVLMGKGPEQVGGIMEFLVAYVDFHFRTEEHFMQKYKYPLYDAHKAQHERLTEEVLKVARRIQQVGLRRDFVAGLVQELGEWIVEHVLKVDRKLGGFLDSLGSQLDVRLPDDLTIVAQGIGPIKSHEDEDAMCGHFAFCSKMFDNFVEEQNRRFWIDRFCRQTSLREQCRRKIKLDSGAGEEEVPKTMLPNGIHMPHLGRS